MRKSYRRIFIGKFIHVWKLDDYTSEMSSFLNTVKVN